MYKKLYTRTILTETPECINEKLDTHSFSGFFFFQIIWKITKFRIIMKIVWLKIGISAKTKKGLFK